jgi:hypothetical protein
LPVNGAPIESPLYAAKTTSSSIETNHLTFEKILAAKKFITVRLKNYPPPPIVNSQSAIVNTNNHSTPATSHTSNPTWTTTKTHTSPSWATWPRSQH